MSTPTLLTFGCLLGVALGLVPTVIRELGTRHKPYEPAPLTPLLGEALYRGVDGPFSSPGPSSGPYTITSTPTTLPASATRMGIQITSDAAGTGTVYGLCGSVAQVGTVSTSKWHFSLAPGGSWDGEASQSIFSGPIQLISTGSIVVGVLEA